MTPFLGTNFLRAAAAVVFLALPNLVPLATVQDLPPPPEKIEGFTYSIIFFSFIIALPKKTKRAYLILAVIFLWWPISLALRIRYHTPITQTFVGLALNSTWHEVRDVIGILSFWEIILAAVAPLCLLRLASASEPPLPARPRLILASLFLATYGLFYLAIDIADPYRITGISNQNLEDFQQENNSLWASRLAAIYPFDLPAALNSYATNLHQTQKVSARLPVLQIISQPLEAYRPSVVVLVIGESSSASHWQLFGYDKPTNPRLKRRENNLYLFNDTITPSVATRTAVPSMISRRPYLTSNGARPPVSERSIMSTFRAAGYATYWLSNQARTGFYENPISVYAEEAEKTKWINSSSFSTQGSYDGDLLVELRAILSDPQPDRRPKFIVLHTLGSHFNYSHRYPADFSFFHPALNPADYLNRRGDPKLKTEIYNSYDNSVLYTDFILDEAISMMNAYSRNSILFFSSDHGEDVAVPACGYLDLTRQSADAYKVPLLIWIGDGYRNKEFSERLAENKDFHWMSTALPQTILDAAEISVSGERTSSLTSPPPTTSRRVFNLNGWADYDAAASRDPCNIR